MSFIVLRDGQQVEIADIATVAAGNDALACLDESIIAIEEQIERAAAEGDTGSDWLIKARTALKHRRRSRAPLQERIGHLRRSEKAAAHQAVLAASAREGVPSADTPRHILWQQAFVDAVRADVPEDQFQRFKRRADEILGQGAEGWS